VTVTVKPGVDLSMLAPAGWVLVDAVKQAARTLKLGVVITCGRDAHPLGDPHTTGEALDLRTKDLTADQKQALLRAIMLGVQRGPLDAPMETNSGLATAHFFGGIEHAGESNEHLHVQRRKATVFTAEDYFNL
jgi:hypothetical protein